MVQARSVSCATSQLSGASSLVLDSGLCSIRGTFGSKVPVLVLRLTHQVRQVKGKEVGQSQENGRHKVQKG